MRKVSDILRKTAKRVNTVATGIQKGTILLLLFCVVVLVGQNYPALAQNTDSSVSLPPTFSERNTLIHMLLGFDNLAASEAINDTKCRAGTEGLLGSSLEAAQIVMSAYATNSTSTADSTKQTGFAGTSTQFCILNELEVPAAQQVSLMYGQPGSSGGLNHIVSQISTFLLDQQPTSAAVFAQEQIERFNNAGVVYAQAAPVPAYFPGSGFEMLRPIQNVWGWAVTASYSALVLVIIIVAIGLALRDRLPGKQTITLNNSIQGIVIAMILIPLSYPIAGLFVDVTTLGSNAIHGFLFRDGGVATSVLEEYRQDAGLDTSRELYADDPNVNIFNMRDRLGIDQVFYATRDNILTSLVCDVTVDENGKCGEAAGGLFGVATGFLSFIAGSNAISNLLLSIIFTVLNIAMLLTGLKIGWFLLKKFIFLLFAPVIMPFSFLTLALPGNISKGAFVVVRQLAATSVCFIVAYGLVLLSIMFSSTSFFATNLPVSSGGGYSYTPPLFGGLQSIFIGNPGAIGADVMQGSAVSLILAIVGIGLYFGIPSTLEKLYKQIAPDTAFPLQDFAKTSFGELSTSFRLAGRGSRKVAGLGYQATVAPIGRRVGSSARSYMNEEDASGKTRYQRWLGDRLQKDVNMYNREAEGAGFMGAAKNNALASATTFLGSRIGQAVTGSDSSNPVNSQQTDVGKADLELTVTSSTNSVFIEGNTILVNENAVLANFSNTPMGSNTYQIDKTSAFKINLKLSFKSVKDKEKPIAAGKLTFSEEPDTVVGLFTGGDTGNANKTGAIVIPTTKQEYTLGTDGSTSAEATLTIDHTLVADENGFAKRDISMTKPIKVTVKNANGSKLEKTFNLSLRIATSSKFSAA